MDATGVETVQYSHAPMHTMLAAVTAGGRGRFER